MKLEKVKVFIKTGIKVFTKFYSLSITIIDSMSIYFARLR